MVYNDPKRRAVATQIASEILDLAGRVVDDLLGHTPGVALAPDERRTLVAIATEVDRQAVVRTGTMPGTVEIAAHGRAAVADEAVS